MCSIAHAHTYTYTYAYTHTSTQLDYSPFDPSIKRTTATLRDAQGKEFEVTKGAPPVVLRMAHNYATIRETLEAAVDDYACRGVRCIAVARTDEQGRW